VSRRSSLLAVGGATIVASLTRPTGLSAAKAGKKARKKCKKQGKQCRQFIIADCQDSSDVQACLDRTLPCCDPFARCNAAAGFACFED
jgi:hypothetical protein